MQNTNVKTLDSSLSGDIDGETTVGDMDAVVGSLKNKKSPGWDGLLEEFYKEFWDIIRPILYNTYIESIDMECMSPSQHIGILTLLTKPKTPMELRYIKNWLPITLLNVTINFLLI